MSQALQQAAESLPSNGKEHSADQLAALLRDLDFDPDALREKYRDERRKRMRKGGDKEYKALANEFSDYAIDPYVEQGFTRAPLTDEIDVVVLGGGFTGLITAARLRQAGISNFRIIENGGDFGGTWYWNRYPGIRCDVESYIYMPLLEETGYVPTEKYARGGEIFEYCKMLGRHFGLYENALFQTRLTAIQWDDNISRWIVSTDRGDKLLARFVCAGAGVLSKPRLPGIPGINDFKGHSFHTSRWDYDYTGGSETGNLTGLRDQRVAIIGTGATAIQAIPYLGQDAKQLYVFQRTPSSVDQRNNKPTDVAWFKSQEPGWQRRRMENFQAMLLGLPEPQDLVYDRWTDLPRQIANWMQGPTPNVDPAALEALADFAKMEEIRNRIDETVTEPATADALKPWYNLWCKRPLFSDEYLQTFNRPNVTLVDMQGRPIDRITQTGIEFDGKHYEVDCIIYASGFDLAAPTYEAGAYELIGKNGKLLASKWTDGVKSLHGTYVREFPNLFILGGIAQASITLNFPHMLGEQAAHAAAMIKRFLDSGVRVFEVTAEAETAWAETMTAHAIDRSQYERECTPGEYNKEGAADAGPSVFGIGYGGGPFEFLKIYEAWRNSGFKKDLDLTFDD